MNILKSYNLLATAAIVMISGSVWAQGTADPVTTTSPTSQYPETVKSDWQPSLVRDGVVDRVAHVNRVADWQPVREADVMWKKRVWREIDTRQKQNMAFRFKGDDAQGGGLFVEMLIDGIKKGKIKAYSTEDDRFTRALTKDQVMEKLIGKPDSTEVTDPITGEVQIRITQNDFNPDAVTKYRIKEDWYFDRNLGRMVVRIIGIAPLLDKYSDEGVYQSTYPFLWIYYPELRETLAQYEVVNPENDVDRMTWDEYFENRHFSSYIVKVSNPFDQSFTQMLGSENRKEALFEGQRAAEQIFNKEHDMWVY